MRRIQSLHAGLGLFLALTGFFATGCSVGLTPSTTGVPGHSVDFLARVNSVCAQLQLRRPKLPAVDTPSNYRAYLLATAEVVRQSNKEIFAIRPAPAGADRALVALLVLDPRAADFEVALKHLDAAARANDLPGYRAARADMMVLAGLTRLRAIQMGAAGLDKCRRAYDVPLPP
jgi:hypothetical protein